MPESISPRNRMLAGRFNRNSFCATLMIRGMSSDTSVALMPSKSWMKSDAVTPNGVNASRLFTNASPKYLAILTPVVAVRDGVACCCGCCDGGAVCCSVVVDPLSGVASGSVAAAVRVSSESVAYSIMSSAKPPSQSRWSAAFLPSRSVTNASISTGQVSVRSCNLYTCSIMASASW